MKKQSGVFSPLPPPPPRPPTPFLSYESRIGHIGVFVGIANRWKQMRRADSVGKQAKYPKNSFLVMIVSQVIHFSTVCLNKEVLKTDPSALNNIRGDRTYINNRSLRDVGYRQFTWWIHNRLGKGVHEIPPSCAI